MAASSPISQFLLVFVVSLSLSGVVLGGQKNHKVGVVPAPQLHRGRTPDRREPSSTSAVQQQGGSHAMVRMQTQEHAAPPPFSGTPLT
jgi:hypothetical protein